MTQEFHCGYVAIVGRPNVGKSTLMNHILGMKLSITSSKPQTTRHRILGIKTTNHAQAIYVDTPGIHEKAPRAMNRYMNRVASASLLDVDLIIFVVEALRWTEEDEQVLQKLKAAGIATILVVNKVDRIVQKDELLPYLDKLSKRMDFVEVIPLSATKEINIDQLEKMVEVRLPESPPFYAEDQITDRSERFLVAEIVREKLMRRLSEELPYALTVEVEQFVHDADGLIRISAVIWVERPSHKGIVIGKGGSQLKAVGQQARESIEALLDSKVYLQLWVKVKEGWSDDERALRSFGYTDE